MTSNKKIPSWRCEDPTMLKLVKLWRNVTLKVVYIVLWRGMNNKINAGVVWRRQKYVCECLFGINLTSCLMGFFFYIY